MQFSEFADKFLCALYYETEYNNSHYLDAETIIQKYDIDAKDHWISRISDDWEHLYFKEVSKVLGAYDHWSFRISGEGSRYIEDKYGSQSEIQKFLGIDNVAPVKSVSSKQANASDRVVSFDHNSADYKEVALAISELKEAIRGYNGEEIEQGEKQRLSKGLDAAESLWQSAQLKMIQIEVGVILAVEDAYNALVDIGKAVVGATLVDLIRDMVKSGLG